MPENTGKKKKKKAKPIFQFFKVQHTNTQSRMDSQWHLLVEEGKLTKEKQRERSQHQYLLVKEGDLVSDQTSNTTEIGC